MKMMHEIPTLRMSREDWLNVRRGSIGGSDAASILGLNTYSTQYEVWADKLGLVPEKPDSEPMRLGRDLEEYVARRFEEATGKRVRRKNAILYNTAYPFAHANVDRLIVGEKAGLECKTTNILHLRKFRNGDFPPHYYVQCQHYMMVTGLPKWYLAVLILGKEFLWFEILRNDEEIRALAAAEEGFWYYVRERKEPPADGSPSCTEVLNAMYDRADPELHADLTMLRESLKIRQRAADQIKELEVVVQEQDNRIKQFMQEAGSGSCDGFSVSWRNRARCTLDTKRMQKEHPELCKQYEKTTTYRAFQVREIKED